MMDSLSESLKGDLDSVPSTDSLHLFADDFHIRPLSTPDVTNIELSKKIALLELENERLRSDLENVRIDLNTRIAANQGLKGKITELYVEVQTVVQEKNKLQSTLTDTRNQLCAAETSAKWYQSQVHSLQANKKTLQLEIDTYQGILRQRQQIIIDINTKYKQLNAEYTTLLHKYQKEKQDLEEEVRSIRSQSKSNSVSDISEMSVSSSIDISLKLESTEDELRDTKAELKAVEQRLLGNEVCKLSMENALNKQNILIASMEDSIQKCETEKNETADTLRKTQFEIQKLKTENETLQATLLSSKEEQRQIEGAILQLKAQLSKLFVQYKSLKIKNSEAEEKLGNMQDIIYENKRLKSLSHEANSSLIRRLRQEKLKVKNLESKLHKQQVKDHEDEMETTQVASMEKCLKQVLLTNKDLKDRLKALAKNCDESIDEGYADSSTINSISTDIPSPTPINTVLLRSASYVLLEAKKFCEPIQTELNYLEVKLNSLREECVM